MIMKRNIFLFFSSLSPRLCNSTAPRAVPATMYPTTRTIDNHIVKLRQKIEDDPHSPVHILTVHGMGYKFVRSDRS